MRSATLFFVDELNRLMSLCREAFIEELSEVAPKPEHMSWNLALDRGESQSASR